jgi:hypothetical protein
VWTLIEIQVGILAACAPTIRPVLHELIRNGLFSGIVSAASSVISRESSRLHMEGPLRVCDQGYPQHEARTHGGSDQQEIIQLYDMADKDLSIAEHVDRPEIKEHGAIHVVKGNVMGLEHD